MLSFADTCILSGVKSTHTIVQGKDYLFHFNNRGYVDNEDATGHDNPLESYQSAASEELSLTSTTFESSEWNEIELLVNWTMGRKTEGSIPRIPQHIRRTDFVDPYQVLQVRRDATSSEIRHAYRRLALWHHPGRAMVAVAADESRDRVSREEERSRRLQIFEILAACYETLMDKDSRVRCDLLLKEAELLPKQPKKVLAGDIRVGGRPVLGTGRLVGRVTSQDESEDILTLLPSLSPASSDSSIDSDDQASSRIRRQDARNKGEDSASSSYMNQAAILPQLSKERGGRRYTQTNQNALHMMLCGSRSEDEFDEKMPSLLNSSSTDASADIHYTERETNRLFGGPLQLLFRARRWKPFSNPFTVFSEVFGSSILFGPSPDKPVEWKPLPTQRCSAWTGSSEKRHDGTVVCTTSRILLDRRFTRTETIRVDPVTGKKRSVVTVTSEEVIAEEPKQSKEDRCPDDLCTPGTVLWCFRPQDRHEVQRSESMQLLEPKDDNELKGGRDEPWDKCKKWLPLCCD